MINKRQHIWKHNGLSGSVRMMEMNCNAIITASSTTPEAKDTAQRIKNLAQLLRNQLSTRIDPWKTP